MTYPRGTDSARVISVIETKAARGAGTAEDPSRFVTQYWDFDGNLLAENDPCKKDYDALKSKVSKLIKQIEDMKINVSALEFRERLEKINRRTGYGL